MGRLWVKFLLLVSFTSFTRLMKLECTYNQIGNLYYCNANKLKITSRDDRTITEVVGAHKEGKKDDDVNTFASDGDAIKYFPKNLEKFFKKLAEIDISNATNFEEITSDDLKPFGIQLKSLWITESKIKSIESNLFEHNPSISEITLSNNQINFVGSGAFSSLKYLKELGFYKNPCFSGGAKVPSTASKEQLAKTIIEVETKCGNSSSSIGYGSTQEIFKCFEKLKQQSSKTNAKIKTKCKGNTTKFKLECIFESVHTYDKYTCYPKSSFVIVSRYDRTINEVYGVHDKYHFKTSSNDGVQLFKSVGNKIKYFPRKLTSFFANLDQIDISYAQLREITKDDLKQFGVKLKAIRIVYNEINYLEEDLFHHNPNLVEVQLDENRIISVGTGALSNMKNVVYVSFFNPCYGGKVYYGKVKEVTAMALAIESNCTVEPDLYALSIAEIIDTFRELRTEVNKINWSIDETCPVKSRRSLERALTSFERDETSQNTNFEEMPSNFTGDYESFMYGNYSNLTD